MEAATARVSRSEQNMKHGWGGVPRLPCRDGGFVQQMLLIGAITARMAHFARHLKQFLTYAFGGSPSYSGKTMRIAHKRLVEEMGLGDEHFDAVIEHLGSTLKELGVPDDLISEAAGIAESTRNDVLNKTA